MSFAADLDEDAEGVVFGKFAAFAKRVDFMLTGRFDADRLIARQFDGDLLSGETVAPVHLPGTVSGMQL